mmetsp:Transcript_24775/g.37877  ORF Transcript_24775/g.37877 Transcript_24775/m.37877 type:complete len:460 (+) Transcript_24775:171-1550(+)
MMRMTFTTFTTGAFLLHLFLVSLFKDNASPFTFTFTSNDVSILQVVEAFTPCCNIGINNRPSYSLLRAKNAVDTSSGSTDSTSAITSATTSSGTSSGPHLITFDLDDTIFPVGPVVHDANVALMEHLASLTASLTNANNANANAPTTTTTCITQSDFIASTKFIRSELAKDGIKITYTELRKRTIQRELERISLIGIEKNDNDFSATATVDISISKEVVSNAYELWEEHRHMAAERHLYHDTIAMLDELKERFPDATIAAITNGKGNPLRMTNTIAKYFDYCISGEDDNVFPYRKPDAGIYKVAVEKYQQEYNNINTGSGSGRVSVSGSDTSSDDDDFCWIHIGDDLANDVGASAQCGAKSIWVDLDEELYNQTTHTGSGTTPGTTTTPSSGSTGTDNEKEKQQQQQQPVWSTATKEEQEMRRILNEEAQKYVAARVQNLSELPDVVKNISISMGSVNV